MSDQTTGTDDKMLSLPPEGMLLPDCGSRCEPPDEENARLAAKLGQDHEYLEPDDEAKELLGESGFASALADANRELGRAEGQENQYRIDYWTAVIGHLYETLTIQPEEPEQFVGRVVPEQEVMDLIVNASEDGKGR